MARNENPIEKQESLGYVVKVQQVIDFIVLSELQSGQLYAKELEERIILALGGSVGVNDGYLSQRLKTLADQGHVTRKWEGDNRYNRFYRITESGMDYFKSLMRELPDRVKRAQQVYNRFESYIDKYGKMKLT
ncbi:PadR family transcriptional regulator [Paenibacillus sp. FSL A5-0031]|uniref:PadR family transcriptional regulator n=1 Tax=Paenibacillus sp. FSL A5-0031 TaxID=1920420 RepID=UPI00096E74BA|nr:helix-turn-helix transcriptional regulator [Paenibacillus sp. FSL A5-0031]OME70105.1 PadR family transcriptional regulator [Paenibacillus sp. FSL A5-0031]